MIGIIVVLLVAWAALANPGASLAIAGVVFALIGAYSLERWRRSA